MIVKHALDLLFDGVDAVLADNVPQELYLLLGELALGWVARKSNNAKGPHDRFDLSQMILERPIAVYTRL